MPSTQSSFSSAKGNDVGPVNKQPPPAMGMSTDPNGPEQRAMRLRGGCFVRNSSAVPMPITYTFSRNAMSTLAGYATWGAAVKEESADATCNEYACVISKFQLLIHTLGRHPSHVEY